MDHYLPLSLIYLTSWCKSSYLPFSQLSWQPHSSEHFCPFFRQSQYNLLHLFFLLLQLHRIVVSLSWWIFFILFWTLSLAIDIYSVFSIPFTQPLHLHSIPQIWPLRKQEQYFYKHLLSLHPQGTNVWVMCLWVAFQ